MASTKAGGSAKNLNTSNPKYLGVKLADGAAARPGMVIVRQRGTKIEAGKNVRVGRDHTLFSIATGTVSFSGVVVGRGVVTITHPDGVRSSLEPVDPLVRVGDRVTTGQAVGLVSGAPGHCAPAVCLHWGVRRGATYLDPLGLLRGFGPIVLLPIDRPG